MSSPWDASPQDHNDNGTFGGEFQKFLEDWAEQRLIGVLTNERLGYLKLINDQNHQIQTLYENIILGGGALHNPSLRLMESADGMTMLDDDNLLLIHGAQLSRINIDNTITDLHALDRSLNGITLIGNTIWGVDANHDIYSVPRLGTMTTQYWQSGDTTNNVYGLAHAGNKLYWLENHFSQRHLTDVRSREIVQSEIACMSASSLANYPSDYIYIDTNGVVRSIKDGATTSLKFQLPAGTYVAVHGQGIFLFALKNTGEMLTYLIGSSITNLSSYGFLTHNPPLTTDPITHATITAGRVNSTYSGIAWGSGLHVVTIRATGETVTTIANIQSIPTVIRIDHTTRLNANSTITGMALVLYRSFGGGDITGEGVLYFIEDGNLVGELYSTRVTTDPSAPATSSSIIRIGTNNYGANGVLPFALDSNFVMSGAGLSNINDNVFIISAGRIYNMTMRSNNNNDSYTSSARPPELFPLLNAKITHDGTNIYAVVGTTLYRLDETTGNVEHEYTTALAHAATDICTHQSSLLYVHSGGISELVITGDTFAEHATTNAPANVIAIDDYNENFVDILTTAGYDAVSMQGSSGSYRFGAHAGGLALDAANTDPVSIATNNARTIMYVLDGTAKKIFDYDLTTSAQNDFSLNTNPIPLADPQTVSSITADGDILYLTYRPPNVDITILATYDLANALPSYTLHTLDTTQPVAAGTNPTTNDANLPHLELPATVAVQGEIMYVLLDSKLYTVSLNSVSYGDVLGVVNLNTESAAASRIAIWRDAIWHYHASRLQIEVLRQLSTRSTASNSKIDRIETDMDTISTVTNKFQFSPRNEVKADIVSVNDTLVPAAGINAFKAGHLEGDNLMGKANENQALLKTILDVADGKYDVTNHADGTTTLKIYDATDSTVLKRTITIDAEGGRTVVSE